MYPKYNIYSLYLLNIKIIQKQLSNHIYICKAYLNINNNNKNLFIIKKILNNNNNECIK